jgi:serine/threonine-protein kinase
MGSVYLGQRRGPAGFVRDVVIKVIHPHLVEQEQFVKMFMDEARLAARINHPNVVQVEELGEEQGTFYLVMERVNGCSLHQIIRFAARRRMRIPMAAAVHIVMKAALGLHAAHDATDDDGAPLGIVHRDVSPSNILVSRDGNVKVIDFGIAKANGRAASTHASHGLKGKLRYMSPEQAWGWEIDRRSDIYSLGVVLWETLAMRALFKAGNELALLEKVRAPEVPPISTVNPDVPPALDAVIAHATARDAQERPATAGELRALLAQAVPDALTVEPELIGSLATHSGDDAPALALVGLADLDDDRPTTPDRSVWSRLSSAPAQARRRGVAELRVALGVAGAIGIGLAVWWYGQRSAAPVEPAPAPVMLEQAESTRPGPPALQHGARDLEPPRLRDSIDESTRTVETTGPAEAAAEESEPRERDRPAAERARSDGSRERRSRPTAARASAARAAARKAVKANASPAPPPPAGSPRPRHLGSTPIADQFETEGAPLAEQPDIERDSTPLAEEFEQ